MRPILFNQRGQPPEYTLELNLTFKETDFLLDSFHDLIKDRRTSYTSVTRGPTMNISTSESDFCCHSGRVFLCVFQIFIAH